MGPRKRQLLFQEDEEDGNSREPKKNSILGLCDGPSTRLRSRSKKEHSIPAATPSTNGQAIKRSAGLRPAKLGVSLPPAKHSARLLPAKPNGSRPSTIRTARLPPVKADTSLNTPQNAPPPVQIRKQNFEVVVWKRTPMQVPVEIKPPKKRNPYVETIIERWPVAEAREEIEDEIALHIRGLHIGDNASALEKLMVSKMKWVNKALRHGYWAFVQKIPPDFSPVSSVGNSKSPPKGKGKAVKSTHGWTCNSPTCRKPFQDGQYRISFELPSRPGAFHISEVIDLTRDNDNNGEGINSIPKNDQDSAFFCPGCFEELLMPEPRSKVEAKPADPFSQEYIPHSDFHPPDGKHIRPSPSCRIYDRFKAETRSDSHEAFLLGPAVESVLQMWKNYNYNQGLSKLSSRNGFMFSMGLSSYQRECPESGLDGVGLAEALGATFDMD
ncbi:hypothetical protein L873DRAFT_1785171 [Choiromyces venosus 120613-1]|uniref:Uncharacterized protein n=1 Tax=Choiromyces venosus 120613-1 TaxID=1336337 RepID=A0A3N4KJR1_9PEZI|nr:hypothetical protein L873DRAFT_1785171 [Choiromyces venosus 120613-1]